jgi:GR25 family glycosyltransferase involved in LPS biosynthesis
MSHLKCLQIAKENGWPHVLIVEDDILFLDKDVFIKQINNFFKNHVDDWDTLLISGNNIPPYERLDDTCVKVTTCQTTTGYLVKSHYYDKLIQNIKMGIVYLTRRPQHDHLYAIDKFWFTLQRADNWLLLTPLTVVQREDYSDIQKRKTNFIKGMIDLDKTNLIKKNP